MELLVEKRPYSISYREGNIFRKYYRFAAKSQAVREGKFTEIFKNMDIRTPQYLLTEYNADKKMYYNEYEFVNMLTIQADDIYRESIYIRIVDVLNKINSQVVMCNDNSEFWGNIYSEEIRKSIALVHEFTGDRIDSKVVSILDLPITKYIHGDFSLDNIGIEMNSQRLTLYDYQLSCKGPDFWDTAYFIASLPIQNAKYFFDKYKYKTDYLLYMIKLVSCLRLGRSLRSGRKVGERVENYNYWKLVNETYRL